MSIASYRLFREIKGLAALWVFNSICANFTLVFGFVVEDHYCNRLWEGAGIQSFFQGVLRLR